jgi:hypothetical protein
MASVTVIYRSYKNLDVNCRKQTARLESLKNSSRIAHEFYAFSNTGFPVIRNNASIHK